MAGTYLIVIVSVDYVPDSKSRHRLSCFGQGSTQLHQQAHFVVDGAGILASCSKAFCSRTSALSKHAAHGSGRIEATLSSVSRILVSTRDKLGMAAQRRQRSQVLGGEAHPLAGEFAQPFGVHRFCIGWIEINGAQIAWRRVILGMF